MSDKLWVEWEVSTKDAYKRLRQHKADHLSGAKFGGETARTAVLNAGLTEEEAWAWERAATMSSGRSTMATVPPNGPAGGVRRSLGVTLCG